MPSLRHFTDAFAGIEGKRHAMLSVGKLRSIVFSPQASPRQVREDDCTICTDPFTSGQKLLMHKGCQSAWHEACILKWLRKDNGKCSCPICRECLIQHSGDDLIRRGNLSPDEIHLALHTNWRPVFGTNVQVISNQQIEAWVDELKDCKLEIAHMDEALCEEQEKTAQLNEEVLRMSAAVQKQASDSVQKDSEIEKLRRKLQRRDIFIMKLELRRDREEVVDKVSSLRLNSEQSSQNTHDLDVNRCDLRDRHLEICTGHGEQIAYLKCELDYVSRQLDREVDKVGYSMDMLKDIQLAWEHGQMEDTLAKKDSLQPRKRL